MKTQHFDYVEYKKEYLEIAIEIFDIEAVSIILKHIVRPKVCQSRFVADIDINKIRRTNNIYNFVKIIKEFAKYNIGILVYPNIYCVCALRNYGVTHDEIKRIGDGFNLIFSESYEIKFNKTKGIVNDSLDEYLLGDIQNICLSYHSI